VQTWVPGLKGRDIRVNAIALIDGQVEGSIQRVACATPWVVWGTPEQSPKRCRSWQ